MRVKAAACGKALGVSAVLQKEGNVLIDGINRKTMQQFCARDVRVQD